MAWSKMVDMELDDESKLDAIMPIDMPSKPDYPYGLRICLTHEELDKLGLDHPNKDDVIDLRAFAVVTSCTQTESENGHTCRVELQSRSSPSKTR
jgi:hypothetical protein